jgi:hypothetical protein
MASAIGAGRTSLSGSATPTSSNQAEEDAHTSTGLEEARDEDTVMNDLLSTREYFFPLHSYA